MSRGLRFVDADGHILEHPSGMVDYAPQRWRDRIWHIETDAEGCEWCVVNGSRTRASGMSMAGVAGMGAEARERARRGEIPYTQVRPAAFNAKPRLEDMDTDGIAQSVLYPTLLLGIQSTPDVAFADVQCRAYNDWLSDHVGEAEGRLFGIAVLPQQDIELAVREIARVRDLPGIVGVMLRPNPTLDWKPMNDRGYDPLWKAASDANLPIGFHPYQAGDLPGACLGLRLHSVGGSEEMPIDEALEAVGIDNIFYSQAIANPLDIMNTLAFTVAGGVCERFPDLKLVFLEANGGWLVSWLERLNHQHAIFPWDAPSLKLEPSEYFQRQCWISFDPDESALAFSANSPLCGADRIVWASDYPHADAVFPGVTAELEESISTLDVDQQAAIAGGNAAALYAL
ncbi:MAG: amidohydrolase family protein [Myxococcales bacterium]|nr:amidohydrolase family protein [Myxococcales bacterium]